MKTLLTSIVSFTIGFAPIFAQRSESDFFTFSARSAQRGKSEEKYKDTSGLSVRETNRSQSVDASVFFTRGPSSQYTVECFFIAQDDDTKELYIYDSQSQKVEGRKGTFTFEAPSLTSKIRRSISFPISGVTVTGSPVNGSMYFSSTATGSKIYGWIVRLVTGEQIVRMETNKSQLKTLAQRNPKHFDAAFGD